MVLEVRAKVTELEVLEVVVELSVALDDVSEDGDVVVDEVALASVLLQVFMFVLLFSALPVVVELLWLCMRTRNCYCAHGVVVVLSAFDV